MEWFPSREAPYALCPWVSTADDLREVSIFSILSGALSELGRMMWRFLGLRSAPELEIAGTKWGGLSE
jgi:hypothetical protein